MVGAWGAREPSARTRLGFVATAAAVGVLGSGVFVWRGTDAAFTATTSNGPNTFSTATVSLTDDDSGGVIFNVTDLVPGSSGTRCITVLYTGTVAANGVHLYPTGLTDTGGLAANINLQVYEGSGGSYAACAAPTGTSIYNGTLAAFAAGSTNYATGVSITGGGAWQPVGTNQPKVYRFTYTIGSSAPMGATCSVTFTWEAQVGT